jgi:hypothetical protein
MAEPLNKQEDRGDLSDVVIAACITVLLYGGLVWFASTYQQGANFQFLILAGITAVALGWVFGILASPYSTNERSSFSELAKLIYGFLSGYLFSKLDPLISHVIQPSPGHGIEERFVAITLFSIASFLIAAGVTYISRTYWVTR